MVQRHIFSVREDLVVAVKILDGPSIRVVCFLGQRGKRGLIEPGTCRRVKLGPEAYLFNA